MLRFSLVRDLNGMLVSIGGFVLENQTFFSSLFILFLVGMVVVSGPLNVFSHSSYLKVEKHCISLSLSFD